MDFNINKYFPADFDNGSRVWIYQSNRSFLSEETFAIEGWMQQFVAEWKSHGSPVKGFTKILFNQFIIIMADETLTGVGGCSTDSSVRVIKEIEKQFNVRLFDRQSLAFVINGKIELVQLSGLEQAIEEGMINAETPYFNNIVLTKEEILNNWIIPAKESWLSKRYQFPLVVND